jgi:hypothetical protein
VFIKCEALVRGAFGWLDGVSQNLALAHLRAQGGVFD